MTADVPADLASRAAAIATTVLADALRDQGMPGQVLSTSLRRVTGPAGRVAGWAHTVVGGPPLPGESGPDHVKAEAIDAMTAGTVAVWAGGPVTDVCLFGDLLALGMQVRGVRGAIVDGGVRDVEDLNEAGFLVVARYATPKASTGFWRVRDSGVPVAMPGVAVAEVTVAHGDLIVADESGVVCVPARRAEAVVRAGEARQVQEVEVRTRILAGERLQDLLREYGRL